jgi:hypothetical protein
MFVRSVGTVRQLLCDARENLSWLVFPNVYRKQQELVRPRNLFDSLTRKNKKAPGEVIRRRPFSFAMICDPD